MLERFLKRRLSVKGSVLQSAEGSVLGQHDAVSVRQHSGSLYAKFINRSCSQEAFSLSSQLATAGSDLLGAEARGTCAGAHPGEERMRANAGSATSPSVSEWQQQPRI